MKLFAVGASAAALAVLPSAISAGGMLVDFIENPVTDWDQFLASESVVSGGQLLGMDEGDEVTSSEDPAILIIGQLREPGEENVFDEVVPEETTPTNATVAPAVLASDLTATTLLRESTDYALEQRMLMSISDLTKCYSTSAASSGSVNVLIAVSSCYSNYGQTLVDAWIEDLKKQNPSYFKGSTVNSINYVKKLVDDGCNCPLTGVTVFSSTDTTTYAAVITITVNKKAAEAVESFVSNKKVPVHLRYVYYKNPEYVTAIAGYNPLKFYNANGKCFIDTIDPFTISRSVNCKNLPGGVPTSYVDANGVRQCVCGCPENYEVKNEVCVPTTESACDCPWEKTPAGYKFEVGYTESLYKSAAGACVIKNLAPGTIPVPIPRDNYVDNLRINDGDLAVSATSPHIDLTKQKAAVSTKQGTNNAVTELGDATATKVTFTWKDFQGAREAKLDNVEFNWVGKYNLGLLLKDYNSDTVTCNGCLAVVDSRRPTVHPSYTCPVSVGSVTTELTIANIAKAQTAVSAVGLYKSNAQNDPCSPNVRCDDDTSQAKRFVDTAYQAVATSLGGTSTWFDKDAVKADLTARLSVSPFDGSTKRATTVTDTCTRCAKLHTQLREWWTPYTCSSTAASPVVSLCEGNENTKCDIEQCVTVNGNSIASSLATLTDAVKTTSKTAVKNLNNDENTAESVLKAKYGLDSSIHVALECSEFPTDYYSLLATDGDDQIDRSAETCSYSTKISSVINIATTSASTSSDALYSNSEVQSFVTWRYQIDNGAWKPWSTTSEETFAKATSIITVEAWTQCGIVATFTFNVVLHLNNIVRVCDHFDAMWYQSTVAPQFVASQEFCLFPKSDFAEITFDYHPNIGLDYDVDKFKLSVSDVSCSLNYEGLGSVPIVGSSDIKKGTFEVVKQFAVNALRDPTKEKTSFTTTCKFTYTRKTDSKLVYQTCDQKFVLKDCEIPVFNKPCELDGNCDFNKCAGTTTPDLYEACGGNRILQGSGATTTLQTSDATCCTSCSTAYTTQCVSINNLPDGIVASPSTPVKRCEAVAIPKKLLAATELEGYSSSTVSGALLAASALVALVAMVVVKRRQAAAEVENDAYYPLMS